MVPSNGGTQPSPTQQVRNSVTTPSVQELALICFQTGKRWFDPISNLDFPVGLFEIFL